MVNDRSGNEGSSTISKYYLVVIILAQAFHITYPGADLGGGCKECAPPTPRDGLRFSNTTGILRKKTMWFIGVEVEQETSAPPPKKKSWIRP